jgi:predicted MFS family arabinose efflux permease
MSEAHAVPAAFLTHRQRAAHWAALPVLLAGTFMIVLDFFIVNVALPAMQANLHAGASAVEWVLAGYGLTLATLLLSAGRLGDRFGRRRIFALGLGLFTSPRRRAAPRRPPARSSRRGSRRAPRPRC